jgi:hypothetical protein
MRLLRGSKIVIDRSMNDLVAGFSKREVFGLLSFRPV